jgi:hypothetical protein
MKTTLYDFYDIISPDAGAMIETLRAYGYHLETSIADIIDNSISADANNVCVDCSWDGENSIIAIKDDGCGMTEEVLKNAMRPGSTNPLQERNPKDLGRFGLGLKTASFSQCRKLTVGSKTENTDIAIRCWDLDYVNLKNEWRLVRLKDEDIPEIFSGLNDMKSGTIVLWEKIDRLTKGTDSGNVKHKDHFFEQLDIVRDHLAMVFHRFLEKPAGLKIFLNEKPVKPWDPFLRNHPSTQHLPLSHITYCNRKISVKPFILPHRSKLDDKTYDFAGGPGGWNERQGFYLYRNERLIVPGDWLGLVFKKGQPIRKEQHTKLARILVDIPNSFDGDWKIDVKKSVARPPNSIREDFQRIARLTIEHAISVYRFRGKVAERNSESSFTFPWSTSVVHGVYHYSINREYPLVRDIIRNSGEAGKKIEAMFRIIEETVPVPLIILNGSNNPDKIQRPFEDSPSEELKTVLGEIWDSLINSGIQQETAKTRLMHMEPFSDYPEYVTEFIRKKNTGE